MKNKKIFLLLALTLFLLPLIKVDAATECGSRYFPSAGGYVTYYNYTTSGFCTPNVTSFKTARGYSTSKPYTKYDGIRCISTSCSYFFTDGSTGCSAPYKDVTYFPTEKVSDKWWGTYCGIELFYKSPPRRNEFSTLTERTCLKKKKGGSYVVKDKDFKYATDSYGYSIADMEKCTGTTPTDEEPGATPSAGQQPGLGPYCSAEYLQVGCSGTDVSSLQSKLNSLQNCGLTVDGNFGSGTETCVKAFQTANGITADGIVGAVTLSKISEAQQKNINNNTSNSSTATNVTYYKVTFDTNGGHFINGQKTRINVVSNSENVSAPETIPGKNGNKFLGWYNGENKYTFGEKTTSDLTLTAKWESVNSTLYCSDEKDVLDYDREQCITAEQFDSSTYSGKVFDLNNTGVLQTIQTKNAFDRTCNNGVYNIEFNEGKTTGANNTVSCSVGYTKDLWKSEDTCNNLTSCTSTTADVCYRTWNSTCYTTYLALDKSQASDEDNVLPEDDDAEIKKSSDKTDKDISSSPKTGNVLFIVALVIGLGALGYSIYYFVKRKKEA